MRRVVPVRLMQLPTRRPRIAAVADAPAAAVVVNMPAAAAAVDILAAANTGNR